MTDLLLIVGGIVLLVVASWLYGRQREADLMRRLRAAGQNKEAALREVERDVEVDRQRADFGRKLRRGGMQ